MWSVRKTGAEGETLEHLDIILHDQGGVGRTHLPERHSRAELLCRLVRLHPSGS